jgi:CIC family chloride channel protein
MAASVLTIGTGGSAGDFAPSLVIGGIFGGAFGRAAQLVFADPRIDPGAFALVGMGAFYGGISHAPLSTIVLVSELAGSYDLLVPLMLAEGIAFVALRNRSLYRAQVATKDDSPVHRLELPQELRRRKVADVVNRQRARLRLRPEMAVVEVVRVLGGSGDQDVFPVVDGERLLGLISSETIRFLFADADNLRWALAADLMQPAVALHLDDDLVGAMEKLVASGFHELPVVDGAGAIVGFIEDADAMRAYLAIAGGETSRDKATEAI